MKFKIGLGIVLIFAVLQLFNNEKVPYEDPNELDFLLIENPEEKAELLIKNICYNCHSNQIKYPWYSDVAPVSWWINDHIEDGRKHLNFSNWGKYIAEKKSHKAEEAWEEIEEKEMPLQSYTFIHREANLTDEQRELLISYFKTLELKYKE